MKITYRTADGRLTFEQEVPNAKTAWEIIALIQELFEDHACGKCKSKEVRLRLAGKDDAKRVHKLVCLSCKAQLDLLVKANGKGLFAKRKDKSGQNLPYHGWYVYEESH